MPNSIQSHAILFLDLNYKNGRSKSPIREDSGTNRAHEDDILRQRRGSVTQVYCKAITRSARLERLLFDQRQTPRDQWRLVGTPVG